MKDFFTLFFATCLAAQEPLTERERMLVNRVEKLEQRLTALEARCGKIEEPLADGRGSVARVAFTAVTEPGASATGWRGDSFTAPDARGQVERPLPPSILPEGTTINVNMDGYFGYNVNRPSGGTNLLRAYDVSSNSFSLNQAGIIFERGADLSKGRRFGGRLDLMFGQATETLQGSPANERRPEVYRHVFQAYGTYIAPAGKGLTVDFGKFASSFGIENNYTKDQLNYSRSYWFNFLPFYHMGFRATYPITDRFNLSYWLTNGLNQTEDFNGFKSQAVLLNFNPTPAISANVNYFNGQEQREAAGRPRGRSHFIDSYITWQANDRLTLAAEADYAISRVEPFSPPQRVTGGAGYALYRLHPKFHLAGRFVYLNDSGGLFSGTSQSLKDATLTATFDIATGFQMRWEYRRDWSDVPYFLTPDPNQRKREQNTALLGLIWWFGGKQGVW